MSESEYRAYLQGFITASGLTLEGDEAISDLEEAMTHLVVRNARR